MGPRAMIILMYACTAGAACLLVGTFGLFVDALFGLIVLALGATVITVGFAGMALTVWWMRFKSDIWN